MVITKKAVSEATSLVSECFQQGCNGACIALHVTETDYDLVRYESQEKALAAGDKVLKIVVDPPRIDFNEDYGAACRTINAMANQVIRTAIAVLNSAA